MSVNKKKTVNKTRIQPCKICNQNHCTEVNVGNSVGDGGELGLSIAKANGQSDLQKYTHAHDFCNLRESRSKPGKFHTQIEAHHLICSEAMDDDDEEFGEDEYSWMDLCNCFGYDINDKENGVYLPSCLEVACAHKVPLHRGNHGATYGSGALNYVDSVIKLVEPIKVNGEEYCKNPKGFKTDLDTQSTKIFGYVKDFIWTITADGKDYKGLIGCFESEYFSTKRIKQLGIILTGDTLSIVEKATEKTLKENLGCDGSNHKNEALRFRKKYNLKISK